MFRSCHISRTCSSRVGKTTRSGNSQHTVFVDVSFSVCQASKSLHELRLLYSHEVKRREDAESEASALRQKAAAAATTLRGGRGGGHSFAKGGGTSLGAAFGGDGPDTAGDGGASPIGKLRQRFFGSSDTQKNSSIAERATAAAPSNHARQKEYPPQQQLPTAGRTAPLRAAPGSFGLSAADALTALAPSISNPTSVGPSPGQNQQAQSPVGRARRPQLLVEPGAAPTVAARSGARPSMSLSGPQAAARPVDLGGGKKPDTPQLASGGYHPYSSARLRGASAGQRPQHGVSAAMPQQRPETPGRPTRPAWQNGGNVRIGAMGTGTGVAADGSGTERTARPQTPRNAQVSSPLAQQQQQQRRRPQVETKLGKNNRGVSSRDWYVLALLIASTGRLFHNWSKIQ